MSIGVSYHPESSVTRKKPRLLHFTVETGFDSRRGHQVYNISYLRWQIAPLYHSNVSQIAEDCFTVK